MLLTKVVTNTLRISQLGLGQILSNEIEIQLILITDRLQVVTSFGQCKGLLRLALVDTDQWD